jgi:hypothetical protein
MQVETYNHKHSLYQRIPKKQMANPIIIGEYPSFAEFRIPDIFPSPPVGGTASKTDDAAV